MQKLFGEKAKKFLKQAQKGLETGAQLGREYAEKGMEKYKEAEAARQEELERKQRANREAEAKKDKRSHKQKYFDNIKESMPPIKRELLSIAASLDNVWGYNISAAIQEGDDRKLVEAYYKALGMAQGIQKERLLNVGKRSAWCSENQAWDAGYICDMKDAVGAIDLGQIVEGDHIGEWIRFTGEGHLMTVAPTRAGKGQGHIMPTLCEYQSHVVVLDPKGENYRETGWIRSGFGKVMKWAPFEEVTDCFNPLELVTSYEDAVEFAELAIVSHDKADPFWDASAREILAGYVFYVRQNYPAEKKNMREVLRLITQSKSQRQTFIVELQASDNDHLVELGNALEDQSENLQSSVFQTLKSHLNIWRSDEIARCTSSTSDNFTPSLTPYILSQDDYLINVGATEDRTNFSISQETASSGETFNIWTRAGLESYYIIIPPEKMATYAPVLRVMLGMILSSAQKYARMAEEEAQERAGEMEIVRDPPLNRQVLFLLDELPQLGYMKVIENAMAIVGSARMRFWLIMQDITQLMETYPKAKSMIANCKMQVYFAPGDMDTAEMISDRVGEYENLTGAKQKIASPQELMGPDFKGQQIIFARGVPPIRAKLRFMYDCPYIADIKQLHEEYGGRNREDRSNLTGRLVPGGIVLDKLGSVGPWPPEAVTTEPQGSKDKSVSDEETRDSEQTENPNKTDIPPPPEF